MLATPVDSLATGFDLEAYWRRRWRMAAVPGIKWESSDTTALACCCNYQYHMQEVDAPCVGPELWGKCLKWVSKWQIYEAPKPE